MKTSHFEGHIALSAVATAQGRDEHTQREPATFDFDLGPRMAWLSETMLNVILITGIIKSMDAVYSFRILGCFLPLRMLAKTGQVRELCAVVR